MSKPAHCFISYHRKDAAGYAARLIDRLELWYAPEHLSYRIQTAEFSEDFSEDIRQSIESANIVLAIIGPDWLATLLRNRHGDKTDAAESEIVYALGRQKRDAALTVIPLLMGGASMPGSASLPDELARLAPLFGKDALVFHDKRADFENQFQRLLTLLEQHGLPVPHFRIPQGTARPFHTSGRFPSVHFHDPLAHLNGLRAAFCDLHDLHDLHGTVTATEIETETVHTKVLQGMGGVGKTQLALQYSHVFQKSYAGVWWFCADDAATLEADCQAMLAANRIAPQHGKTPSVAMQNWLSAQTCWLLVYDNANDPSQLKHYLPTRGRHHVLITSRRPDWQGLAGSQANLRQHPWTGEQALDFLRKRLPFENQQALHGLALDLGGLPLALENAAGYLNASGLSSAEYRGFFADPVEQGKLLARPEEGGEPSVSQILGAALARLTPAARQLLDLCAVCAPQPIPESLFRAHPELLPSPLNAHCKGLAWADLIKELQRAMLAERDAAQQTLTLHCLTQAVARLSDPVANASDASARRLLDLLMADLPNACGLSAHQPHRTLLLPHIESLRRFAILPDELEKARCLWLDQADQADQTAGK